MKKHLRSVIFIFLITIAAACASPVRVEESDPSFDQVETLVALTFQALAPETAMSTSAPATSPSLLPHSLYFLGNDNQAISQVYRLERDGTTKTQLTYEPVHVWDYAISRADGSIAYETNNQLVLIHADGSNRRVLVEGVPDPEVRGFYHPVFSPDGQTLAFAHKGLNLYSVSTGATSLVLADQMKDIGDGHILPVETYAPESYSPDGTKLLVALGHWEVAPSHAIYSPATNTLMRYAEVTDYVYCCSFHGGPSWAPDSSSFYGVASIHDTAYKSGELWKVEAANGSVIRMLNTSGDMLSLPKKPFLAPDGQLYFFFGTYHNTSGYFDAPVLELVRSAPDGVTGRTALREENFVLMNEALWAPDASFVIVAMMPEPTWTLGGGTLELYYTDGQKPMLPLAPFGRQMKWGP